VGGNLSIQVLDGTGFDVEKSDCKGFPMIASLVGAITSEL
jgi:hypothetical protein